MPNYKSMYFQLAAKVADAVELLTIAQLQGEEAFEEGENATVVLLPRGNGDEKEN